jgi:DNA segregation ATPase FtsK/SpoIIIE-like protein
MTQPEVAAPVRQQTTPDNREIRFSLGGQISTLKQGQEEAVQPVQAAPIAQPAVSMAPVQPAGTEQRSGVLSRFAGLGNRANRGSDAGATPPPLVTPLPMDDPIVPLQQPAASTPVQQPLISTPASYTSQPAATVAAEVSAATPAQAPVTFGGAAESFNPSAAAVAPSDGGADEVDAVAKARQDRLNALRRGEMGPLSSSTLQTARREEAEKAAYVPSSEAQRERSFNQMLTSEESPVSSPAAEVSEDTHHITPPSQLPSAQSSQEVFQRSLSQPISSEVRNQSRPKVQWRVPDFRTLLSSGSEQELDKEFLLKQAKIIENTLREFGAPGRVVEINTGPVITQFGVEPDYQMGRGGKKQRVKVSAIAALDKDLQLALGARSIRIEAPVPGKGYVGVEVPNAESTLVSLRDVMDSSGFNKYKSPLAIALGQSVSGAPISADLSAMPHLLIAGTTGSGKSVCVNSIIASVISRNTPDVVKFIMVDPKRVELTGYNGIPHLVAPVVVELERIVGVLKWVTREMDERYRRFSDAGARNIEDFNKHRDQTTDPMPYIIVIIDELADLMMLAPEETERTITRIAALARATGIHLVIATQRPSVDVVTGLIKANFPARIAFAVAGSVDSRVILDQPGAERLLGKGDMLYLSGDSPAPLRLQGVYVSDMEINNIVRYWKLQAIQQPESSSSLSLAPRFTASETPKDARPRSDKSRQQALWDSGESLPSFATGKSRSSAPVLEDDEDYDEDEDFDDDDFDEELSDEELSGDAGSGHEDELYEKSVELVRRLDKASISLLQRRLRIGYTRAARLIDVMEARGVVGPAKEGSSKPRDVLPN